MSQLLACNDMWLDGAPTVGQGATNCSNYPYAESLRRRCEDRVSTGNQDGSGSGAGSPWTYTNYWWPYYPVYTASPARPIKLKMSEVERLRKAAKDDSKLKAILNKFTAQIEIEVDFD